MHIRLALIAVLLLGFSSLTTSTSTPSPVESPIPHLEAIYTQMFMAPVMSTPQNGDQVLSVLTMVMVMQSPDDAEAIFNSLTNDAQSSEQQWDEQEDLGDQAVTSVYEEGSTEVISGAMVRDGEIIVMTLVTATNDQSELVESIVRFVLETGPSETEEIVADDLSVSGSWADAFPQPDDIDGLARFDPAPVHKTDETGS